MGYGTTWGNQAGGTVGNVWQCGIRVTQTGQDSEKVYIRVEGLIWTKWTHDVQSNGRIWGTNQDGKTYSGSLNQGNDETTVFASYEDWYGRFDGEDRTIELNALYNVTGGYNNGTSTATTTITVPRKGGESSQLPFNVMNAGGSNIGYGNIVPGSSLGRARTQGRVIDVDVETGAMKLQLRYFFEVTQGDDSGFEGANVSSDWGKSGPIWSFSGNPYLDTGWISPSEWYEDWYSPGETATFNGTANYTGTNGQTQYSKASASYTIPAFSKPNAPSISSDKLTVSEDELINLTIAQSGGGSGTFKTFQLSYGVGDVLETTATNIPTSPKGIIDAAGGYDEYFSKVQPEGVAKRKYCVYFAVRAVHDFYGKRIYSPWQWLEVEIAHGSFTVYDQDGNARNALVTAYDAQGNARSVKVSVYDEAGNRRETR